MKSTRIKKLIAGILIFTLALVSPMRSVKSEAAGKTVTYIKEFKLFIKKGGTESDAKDWCKTQSDGDWKVVEGDLNAETDGVFTRKVGVFLCYCTTENEDEAVRDIAVMNEQGNYSESNYKMILENQKNVYKDLVSDLKTQIKGYQENLKNEVKTAVEAHDLLNGFKEDDSEKLLGDFLAELDLSREKDEETLTNVLFQANGSVVLFIQQELSLACESGTKNWLDRMEQIGGYDRFYQKIKNAYNGDDRLAKRNMEKKYKEKAVVIADAWDELKQNFEGIKEYEEKCGIASMSEEEIKEWKENNLKTADGILYEQKAACFDNLAMYTYEGKTLLEFFLQDKSEISGNNLYKLYPMVSCLQPGQLAGINSTVNLYALIGQAFSATVLNDYDKGKLDEVKDEINEDQKENLEESRELVEKCIDQQGEKEAESIYEGVDREVFGGGVAVTSDALDFNNSSETNWTDSFVKHNVNIQTKVGIGLCFGGFATIVLHAIYNTVMEDVAQEIVRRFRFNDAAYHFSEEVANMINGAPANEFMFTYLRRMVKEGEEEVKGVAKKSMEELAKAARGDSTSARVFYGLSRGLTFALLLVAVADVVLNIVALYNYYNRDHLPIPHHIVDMTTNRNKETSFVTYKSVRDNTGECGDLNGNSAKQWLALYQTHDEDAGTPILAPDNGEEFKVVVQYGSADEPKTENYTSLHLFGAPNTPQNLTFADGESGWSYNDGKNGTFVFFRKAGI